MNILKRIEENILRTLTRANEIYSLLIHKGNSDAACIEKAISNLSKNEEILQMQTKLLNQVLTDKYEGSKDNNQFKAVVFIPYRGNPIVFKDGEKLYTENMTSFNVDWTNDGQTDINIRHE